jgi:endonuclease/exonuclease/phosphatase family metal-dependent hydrolase
VYETVGVGRNDGKKAGEQCCVLYRKDRFDVAESGTFWFSDTPEIAGSKHWGNMLPRICTWVRLIEKKTGRGFYIYNVHLDHQSEASRVRSTKLLAQRVAWRKPIEPFVVMGDFNSGPDSPEMAYLLRQPETKPPQAMMDVLAVARPEQRNIGTYHAFTGRTDGARIDMILTDPDVKTQNARIDQRKFDGRYASDHFPVAAELNLF